MSFSKIQLASNALILLGDEPISSFNDPGAGAKAAANLYDSTLLSLLSSHRWNFATKKVLLSQLTASPLNEYKFQYQLPTDYITIITTYPVSTYRILEDKLYSDSNKVEIDYVYRPTEDKLPNYFIKAFEYYLARELCIAVTEDLNKYELVNRAYEVEARKARYADSQSAPQVPIQDDPYIRVRVI